MSSTPEICKTCTSASCFKGTEKADGCPLFEFPKTMTSSANCNICANCVKNCPNDSIQLTLRAPSKELWFIRKPKLEEAFLFAVIMGIVFVQNVTMLEAWTPMLGSLYTAYRIAKAAHSKEKVWGTFVPFAVLMIILGIINIYLFVLPMAMRM